MKEYALVFTTVFAVMLYADWQANQIGCVMETSDDRDYLENEAEVRNGEIEEDDGEDDWENERNYMRHEAQNRDLTEDEHIIYGI